MGNEKKVKSTRRSMLLLALVLPVVGGLIAGSIIVISRMAGVEPVNDPKETDFPQIIEQKKEQKKNKQELRKHVKRPAARRPSKFKTNDDIRQEYGMIETVYLYNGKSYTGAVITCDEQNYKIVTVDGEISIEMKEVKMRTIIH